MSLPPSLPSGWPNRVSTSSLKERPSRIISVGSPQQFSFCNNSIKTSKYGNVLLKQRFLTLNFLVTLYKKELWNFIPKFLLEEFNPSTKIANCYFLLIAGMQCIPIISNTRGIPTVLIPLIVVLMISGVFKSLEDFARHKADKKANSSICQVLNRETEWFEPTLWSAVKVGDLVKIISRESIPADLIVLAVSRKSKK
jgi:magnesium-transporting ATPase (P-type)